MVTSDTNHPGGRATDKAAAESAKSKQPAHNLSHVSETAAGDPYAFSDLKGTADAQRPANLDFILDIPLEITVELGRTKMLINDLLKLGQGSVIELTKAAGETLEILANNRLIAKGDVVVVNEKYGIRLTEVISPVERLEKLK
ncbi:MAG: flagellar motor switch protein FliN [Desulfobacteraceae bacterium]|nr:MAG: flagellar motor switch protein FliN [Desulfobacteraceae bacterium]